MLPVAQSASLSGSPMSLNAVQLHKRLRFINTRTYKHKIRSYVKCFSLPVITTNLTQTLPAPTPLFDKAVMWVSPLTLHTVHVAKHYSCL
jgi:hypothetical protein